MQETGYGSDEFLRACRLAAARGDTASAGPRATWGRLRASSALARYERRLPITDLRLTTSPSGRMIAQHFAIRDGAGYRYRTAQGVLALPTDFADYMRGRHRQAVRTNIGHARRAGLTVQSTAVDGWAPGLDDTRRAAITPGPIERWAVFNTDGSFAAEAILSVDEEVALLQGSVSFTPNARWLIHTAIVERLCGACEVLVTNSPDAYFLGSGHQHFQRLLGYGISRLRLTVAPAASTNPPQPAGLPWPPAALPCGIAPTVREPEPVLVAT
jgi:hypothetical protein